MASSDLGLRYHRFLQMFWDPEPKNDEPGKPPIYCLGRKFDADEKLQPTSEADLQESQRKSIANIQSKTESSRQVADTTNEAPWPDSFLDDFESRLWFTYRSDFPPIPRSEDPDASAALTLTVRLRNIGETNGFTSDTGWGCMIRSGQCLVGNALAILRLGRDWRRGEQEASEKELVSLFADSPRAPFSIHKFVEHGSEYCGKHPGEWFGPSATAQCIEALSRKYCSSGLKVYIASEGAQVYEGSLEQVATSGKGFAPTLILAGIRLGIDRITPVYREALRGIFKLDQTIGVAGGRPSASHYFLAAQGEHFFYLDPHHTRAALPFREIPSDITEEEIESLHTRRLRRLHVEKMDPSMLLGFLIRNQTDFDNWKLGIQNLSGKAILHIVPGKPPGDITRERESALDEVEAFDDEDDEFQEIESADANVKTQTELHLTTC